MKIGIGKKARNTELEKEIDLPKNLTTTPSRNYLMIATQGSGKTNVLMLFCYQEFTLWKETGNQYGALPIIFAPTFEFMQMEVPSKAVNLPPGVEPQGIECVNITFPICDPIKNDRLQTCSFDFGSFEPRDILGFTDIQDEDKYLGAIKKLIERIENGYEKGRGKDKLFIPPRDFTLKSFLEEVRDDASLKDALYYVFTELKKAGMFDTGKYPALNIRELILQKKPIIFHFGDLDERQRMSGIAGIILKELWQISNIFYNAYLKQQAKQPLDEFEQFLIDHWTIMLIMEEAHQILYATKSSGMALESKHPSHYWFKKITALMGRKRGFKRSMIVTQKFMEIFYGIRTTFDDLILGSTIYPDDKVFLEQDLKIDQDHINKMTRLPKFAWAFVDIQAYQKRKKKCVAKVRCYLSPCGQPK